MPFRKAESYVPRRLWTFAGRAARYARRLRTWQHVLAQIKGASRADRATLKRSALRGLSSSFDRLDDWQDPVLLNDADVISTGVGRFHVRADTDDLYHVLPAREPAILSFIAATLDQGDTFIDAGANIGFYTICAARAVGPRGHVIAVEMMADTASILRRHIELNELANVDVVEKALSDRSGGIVSAGVPHGKFGQASIVRADADDDASVTSSNVETITLDDVVGPAGKSIALMKMDLEGAEYLALLGAKSMLRRVRTVVFEQIGSDARAQNLLTAAGFRIRSLDGNNFVAERS